MTPFFTDIDTFFSILAINIFESQSTNMLHACAQQFFWFLNHKPLGAIAIGLCDNSVLVSKLEFGKILFSIRINRDPMRMSRVNGCFTGWQLLRRKVFNIVGVIFSSVCCFASAVWR